MREVVVPLGAFPPEVTSVTYPDSFTAMAFGPRFGLPHQARPYHEQVFLLAELPELVARYGLPRDESDPVYDDYPMRPFEKYIEVQLWADEPLRAFLEPNRNCRN
jgi:hypothetical protein